MRPRRVSSARRFLLLLHLLASSLTCTSGIEVTEEAENEDVRYATISSNQLPAETTTTDDVARLTTVSHSANESDPAFRPSMHLGAIEEPIAPLNNPLGDAYRDASSLLDEATRSSRIRFEDEVATPASHWLDNRQSAVPESPPLGHVYGQQSFFQSIERPTADAHEDPPSAILGDERRTRPYGLVGYYAAQRQPVSHAIVLEVPIGGPESNAVLLQESTYTRRHKFPYQFYQPTDAFIGGDLANEQRQLMTSSRTTSWKKIARLIGALVPLGLLLATLTPNVVRVNNVTTTPASIVLSKLRAADLPVEHKRALDRHSAACDDRSICQLILAGGERRSDMLRNVLWNLAMRTPDDIARRNGLREVLAAVRNRDCTTIDC